jgi:diguanylate cyclase
MLAMLPLVTGALLIAGYHSLPSLMAHDLYFFGVNVAAAVAMAIGIRYNRPAYVTPWYLLLVGLGLWAIANALWAYYELVLELEPFPSLADLFYLGSYGAISWATGLLVRRRARVLDIGVIIDAVIITVGIGVLAWVYFMEPLLQDTSLSLSARAVSIAYPLMDLFLIIALTQLLLSPGARTRAFLLLGLGFVTELLADIAFLIVTLNGSYSSGHLLDSGWILTFVCWSVAALDPSMRTLAEPAPDPLIRVNRRRLVLLAAASLLAPLVFAIELARGRTVNLVVIVGCSALLFLLSLARMNGLVQVLKSAKEELEVTLADLHRTMREYRRVEAELAHQAYHDTLTDLPNRLLFKERLERALQRAEQNKWGVAVLFLDLDGFKHVNDSLGHEAGDILLVAVADRLRGCLRAQDLAGRLGGDEFIVLLEGLASVDVALRTTERIIEELHVAFTVGGRTLFVSASIGIAYSKDGQERAEELLRRADIAMYQAKADGKGGYRLFAPAMDDYILVRVDMEAGLRAALERHEFRLLYQPVVHLASKQIVSLEVLIRWQHPQRGLIPPDTFIPLAEETRLIVPIGRQVLEEACRQARAWNDRRGGGHPLTISVNLSPRQFQHPQLVDEIAEALQASRLPARLLALEITESTVMDHRGAALEILRSLKALGVQIWIDDFGTGYSSLSYLKRFPVDRLKIDKSFIDGLGRNPQDAAIVHAIVKLAHSLGMQVTAEGVEMAEQAAQLHKASCDCGQGHYFSKPLPAAAIGPLLQHLP